MRHLIERMKANVVANYDRLMLVGKVELAIYVVLATVLESWWWVVFLVLALAVGAEMLWMQHVVGKFGSEDTYEDWTPDEDEFDEFK